MFDDDPDEKQRWLWLDWCAAHGVVGDDVCVPGWVEVHGHQVAYLAYKLDDGGQRQFDDEGDDVVREVRTVECEQRPARFPQVAS